MTQELEIDVRKFVEYSMNPNHPDNQGKWIAFNDLGYDVTNPQNRQLAAQDIILQLHQNWDNAELINGQSTIHGDRFKKRIKVKGFNEKEGTLVTIWQIDRNSSIPRLITNWLEVDR